MAITTDIIVGFPGETSKDFEETLEVMDLVQFDNSYSYAFSPRPGTIAAGMAETVTHEEKLERLAILQAKQEEIMAKRLDLWVGREVEVLVDNRNLHREDCFQGRISQGIMLNFDNPYPDIKLGSLVKTRVTARKRFTLVGEPV
jgi:tRNA-2-methylthio-N6-dimethylallyladenosine synthase